MSSQPYYPFGPPPQFDRIPPEIQSGSWCVWKARPRPGKAGKVDKIPSSGVSDHLSTKATDQWLTYDQAKQLYLERPGTYNGVGRLADDLLVYVDVDNESVMPMQDWIDRWPTYCEISPSGNGLHFISLGTVSRDTNAPVEVYAGHAPRFMTITGAVYESNAHAVDLSQRIEDEIIALAPAQVTVIEADMPEMIMPAPGTNLVTFDPGDRSAQMFGIVHRLLNGGLTPGEALGLLWESPDVSAYAMDHREGRADKALKFLWSEVRKAMSGRSESPFQEITQVAEPGAPGEPLQAGQVSAIGMTGWQDLGGKYFDPVRWLVDEFLPPGVTMLVGKPKFGKSWLVHGMLLRIAAGGEMFGHQVKQSKVLYMALEDSERRLKDRTIKLLGSMNILSESVAGSFSVTTECARLGAGLEEQLLELLTREPELRVIAIDVLAMIRGARAGNQALFDYDYQVGHSLKKLCAQFPDLAIILVHHAAKYAVDSSEATSGTNGLNAGMDNVLVLMKGENGPVLHIHARDVEDDTPIPMVRGGDGMWTMDSREIAGEAGMSDTRTTILSAIDEGAATPADIVIATGLEKGVVEQQLYRMVRADVLMKTSRGHYARATAFVSLQQVPVGLSVSMDGVPEFLR